MFVMTPSAKTSPSHIWILCPDCQKRGNQGEGQKRYGYIVFHEALDRTVIVSQQLLVVTTVAQP